MCRNTVSFPTYPIIRMVTFICLILFVQVAAFGQAILLPKDDVLPRLEQLKQTGNLAFYVNGPFTYGLSDTEADQYYELGRTSQIILSAVTLRLIDQGKLSLDDPAPVLIPDILEEIPFRKVITIKDLLSNTAGFAVPPWHAYLDYSIAESPNIIVNDFKPYIIQVRGAAQIPHDDPVGWAVLAQVLSTVSAKPINQVVTEEFLTPLGLRNTDIAWDQGSGIFSPVINVKGSGRLIAEIGRLLIRNRSLNARYLSPETYELLTDTPSWKLHPLAPKRVLSLEKSYVNGVPQLETLTSAIQIVAFPDQGAAFIFEPSPKIDTDTFVDTLAKEYFPQGSGNPEIQLADKLREPKFLNGVYVKEQYPNASLKLRLQNIENSTVKINRLPNGDLSLTGDFDNLDNSVAFAEQNILFFKKVAPYYYVNHKDQNDSLVFSPARAGGYFQYKNQTYRHVGLLGDKSLVIDPAIWLIALLLSAIVYYPKIVFQKQPLAIQIRRMGLFSFLGAALIAISISCEIFLWSEMLYVSDKPIYIFLWRLLLNIGLMAILTIPMFTLSITKRKLIPSGLIGLAMNMHIIFLTAASLLLFFITIAWGVAGEFWAY
ncbi:serine hydrolase [Kordiimonas sp. SCSIO 12610]|uniref:serine hydrolase domain-containing protein n=1 Tax=Kordiimonas sp. SCSIO 12610 TaxID=2829597 RepID=UPI00210C2F62|nr:serine hydrolase [Kordiimonas sp. SCSIO 12610]UTW55254.1 serine hydrolase [Kordiimonas sp. SCSIO 12610]